MQGAEAGTQVDDRRLFCELCQQTFRYACPSHGPPQFVRDSQLSPEGEQQEAGCRAVLSLPQCLVLIERPGADGATGDLGVFAQTLLPRGWIFGPYEGEELLDKQCCTKYSWAIKEKGFYYYVDASDESKSNWMRYVTCACNEEEQNLTVFQYHGRIHYRVSQPVPAGAELRVWIGREYAAVLGLQLGENIKVEFGEKESLMRIFQDIQVVPVRSLSPPVNDSLDDCEGTPCSPRLQGPPAVIGDGDVHYASVAEDGRCLQGQSPPSSTLHTLKQSLQQPVGCVTKSSPEGVVKYKFVKGSESLVSLNRAQSRYWTFFGFEANCFGKFLDKTKIICKLCGVRLAYSGNTTNLRQHLIYKHRLEYDQLMESGSSVPNRGRPSFASLVSFSSGSPKVGQRSPQQQAGVGLCRPGTRTDTDHRTDEESPSVSSSLSNRSNAPSSSEPQVTASFARTTGAIAEFLVRDLLPPDIVEGEGFRHLMSTLLPSYEVPSAHLITETVLREAHSEGRRRCAKLLSDTQAPAVSEGSQRSKSTALSPCLLRIFSASSPGPGPPSTITTSLTSPRVALSGEVWRHGWLRGAWYVSLTAHFIDEEFTQHNLALGSQQLGGAENEIWGGEQRLRAAEGETGCGERRLRAAEGETGCGERRLRAAENEIWGSEQRLRAAEGEIWGGEQRLRAAENEIWGGEQRLRAAEGETGCGEQRLRAAEGETGCGERRLRAAEGETGCGEQRLRAAEGETGCGERRLRAAEGKVRAMALQWGIAEPSFIVLGGEDGLWEMEKGIKRREVSTPCPTSAASRQEESSERSFGLSPSETLHLHGKEPDGFCPTWASIPCIFTVLRVCVELILERPEVRRTLSRAQPLVSKLVALSSRENGSASGPEAATLSPLLRDPIFMSRLKAWVQGGPRWNVLYSLIQILCDNEVGLTKIQESMVTETKPKVSGVIDAKVGLGAQANVSTAPSSSEEVRTSATPSANPSPDAYASFVPSAVLEACDWLLLRDLCMVLKPLDVTCSTLARERSPSISLIKPILTSLLSRHFAPSPGDSPFCWATKRMIRDVLRSHFSDSQVNRALNMACALDPRFQGLKFLEAGERAETFDWLKRYAVGLAETGRTDEAEVEEQERKPGRKRSSPGAVEQLEKKARLSGPLRGGPDAGKAGDGRWPDHGEREGVKTAPHSPEKSLSDIEFLLGDLCSPHPHTAYRSLTQQVEREVAIFRAELGAELGEEPLQWWQARAAQLPLLARVARIYLAAPATAGYGPHLFTQGREGGDAMFRKRASIPPDVLDQLLFLHDNRLSVPAQEAVSDPVKD